MSNQSNIPLIPEVPQEIISAIEKGELILFVGAGVSAIAGLPLWSTLANSLIRSCKDLGYISEQDCDLILTKISDPKKLISIAFEKYSSNENKDAYYQKFVESLKPPEKGISEEAKVIFDFCKKSNALVLTTNADLLLDDYFEDELVFNNYSDEVFLPGKAALVKIHGSLNDINSLVFTSVEYLKRYADHQFKSFLHSIFSENKTILFIGYGLSEFELLEYTLGAANANRHNIYILNPYFSYEKTVKESMDLYYDSLNIQQIAYCKDRRNYNQLADVLNNWMNKIERETKLKSKELKTIDKCLCVAEYKKMIPTVLQLTSTSYDVENYFFVQLRKNKNIINWIDALLETSLFDSKEKLKPAIEKTTQNGGKSYRSVEWNGISIIAYILNNYDCSAIADKITIFLHNTLIDILSNPQKVTNFNAMFMLSKIISCMDTNVLGNELFEYIKLIFDDELDVFNEFFMELLSDKSKFFNWDASDISDVINILIDYFLGNITQHTNYIIAECVCNNIDFFCQHITNEKADFILNSVSKLEFDDPFMYPAVGSIECYKYDNSRQETKELILYILKNYFKNNCNNENKITFRTYFDNSSRTIQKLMMFAVSQHYELYKDLLYNSENNPFDVWYTYSDMYYLIEQNNMIISDIEREKLYGWIVNSNFGNKLSSESYISFLKYKIISLLGKYNKKYRQIAEEYNISAIENDIEIDDINKMVHFGPVQEHSNDKIIQEMGKMTLQEISSYLSNINTSYRFEFFDYCDALKTIVMNDEKLIYENVSQCILLPPKFYCTLIRAISEKNNTNRINDNLKIINELVAKTTDLKIKKELLVEVYRYFEKITDNQTATSKNIKSMYNIVFNSLKDTEEAYFSITDSNHKINFDIIVINNWFTIGISVFLSLSLKIDEYKKVCIDYIDKILKRSCAKLNHEVICCTLARNFSKIIAINETWTYKNLDKIILSLDCIKSVLYSRFMSEQLYNFLSEQDWLKEMIYSTIEDHDIFKEAITDICITAYFRYNNNNINFIKEIIQTKKWSLIKCIFITLNYYINIPEYLEKSDELLIIVCEEICTTQIDFKRNSDQLIKHLSRCIFSLNTVDNKIWNCLIHMSKSFNMYFSDEVFDAFNKHFNVYKSYIADIFLQMVESGKLNYISNKKKFRELVLRIKNDSELGKEFTKLNNILISKNIYNYN